MAQWMPDPRGEDELFAEEAPKQEPQEPAIQVPVVRRSSRESRGPPGWRFRAPTDVDEAMDRAKGEAEWEAEAEAFRQALIEREGEWENEEEEDVEDEEEEEEEMEARSTWSYEGLRLGEDAAAVVEGTGRETNERPEDDGKSDIERESEHFEAFWDEKMLKEQFSQEVRDANSRLKRKAAQDLPNGIFGLVKLAAQVEKELWYKHQRQPSYHPIWKSISCLAILHLDENWDTIMARLKPPPVPQIQSDEDNDKLQVLMGDASFSKIWKRIEEGSTAQVYTKPNLEETVDAEPMEGPRQDEHGWYIMHWYPEGKKEKVPLNVHRTIHTTSPQ